MPRQNWKCPKYNSRNYETGQLSGTGGFFSKFFNIQNQTYTTVTCMQCKYTEMYKGKSSTLGNIVDFFGN